MRLYNRPRVASTRRLMLIMSGDEVIKKLKQNINRPTVDILTLMMAFHDGTSHNVATKVGDYNTLMYGQFSLATGLSSLLAYSNKSPIFILI